MGYKNHPTRAEPYPILIPKGQIRAQRAELVGRLRATTAADAPIEVALGRRFRDHERPRLEPISTRTAQSRAVHPFDVRVVGPVRAARSLSAVGLLLRLARLATPSPTTPARLAPRRRLVGDRCRPTVFPLSIPRARIDPQTKQAPTSPSEAL